MLQRGSDRLAEYAEFAFRTRPSTNIQSAGAGANPHPATPLSRPLSEPAAKSSDSPRISGPNANLVSALGLSRRPERACAALGDAASRRAPPGARAERVVCSEAVSPSSRGERPVVAHETERLSAENPRLSVDSRRLGTRPRQATLAPREPPSARAGPHERPPPTLRAGLYPPQQSKAVTISAGVMPCGLKDGRTDSPHRKPQQRPTRLDWTVRLFEQWARGGPYASILR